MKRVEVEVITLVPTSDGYGGYTNVESLPQTFYGVLRTNVVTAKTIEGGHLYVTTHWLEANVEIEEPLNKIFRIGNIDYECVNVTANRRKFYYQLEGDYIAYGN